MYMILKAITFSSRLSFSVAARSNRYCGYVTHKLQAILYETDEKSGVAAETGNHHDELSNLGLRRGRPHLPLATVFDAYIYHMRSGLWLDLDPIRSLALDLRAASGVRSHRTLFEVYSPCRSARGNVQICRWNAHAKVSQTGANPAVETGFRRLAKSKETGTATSWQ